MIRRRKKDQDVEPPRPIQVLYEFTAEDEEYVNMMLKKSARRTLQKHRREIPVIAKEQPLIDPEMDELLTAVEKKVGIRPAEITPIKNCRKCYFSKSIRVVGNEWYCQCSNVAKSTGKLGWTWIRCESNLSCWREPDRYS
ncbi:MAG: hypothetical protein ACFFE2_16925 [Candidatus Thorarchaeota archaeon]